MKSISIDAASSIGKVLPELQYGYVPSTTNGGGAL